MAKKTNSRRAIDEKMSKASKNLKSRFVLIPSMKIKSWKALIIIMFVAGFAASIVWSAYNSWYIGSSASTVDALRKGTKPAILSVAPAGELPGGTTSTVVTVKTKKKAICKISSNVNDSKPVNVKYTKFKSTGKTTSTTTVTGLQDKKIYAFLIVCKDTKSTKSTGPAKVNFSVGIPLPPGIVNDLGNDSDGTTPPATNPTPTTDTPPSPSCVGFGGKTRDSLKVVSGYLPCCVGLTEIDSGYQPGGLTAPTPTTTYACQQFYNQGGLVCSPCGNGTCESAENRCNCPADCK